MVQSPGLLLSYWGTKCLLELPIFDNGHLFARLKTLRWGGNSCWWLFGEVLQWELLMESIPAIAGCPVPACSFLGHLMLLPVVAVIFLKQRDSEDHIMLDFCPHPF